MLPLRLLGSSARRLKNAVVAFANDRSAKARLEREKRRAFDRRLGELLKQHREVSPRWSKVVIDSTFDNEGYFFRVMLLMRALGIEARNCRGVLGRYKAAKCRQTIFEFGVENCIETPGNADRAAFRHRAAQIMAGWTKPEDILKASLPGELPSSILYDCLLKRQRAAIVDLSHPDLLDELAIFLKEAEDAADIVRSEKPSLVIVSHTITATGAALTWFALNASIPVIHASGSYGSARFYLLKHRADFFATAACPRPQDIDALSKESRKAFEEAGQRYLDARFGGRTTDLSGIYAFGEKNRSSFDPRALYGWSETKPIIGVFASNWFDYPHVSGMTNFRDLEDWVSVTVEAACRNANVNWLIRGHPCDAWYGGVTIGDVVMRKLPPHVRICDPAVSGKAVMETIDAAVTLHGTVGVEYAAFGKEVLLGDVGWYHQFDFALLPTSREAYVSYLEAAGSDGRLLRPDPLRIDHKLTALAFVGLYFCTPEWQSGFSAPDDSERANGIDRYLEICRDPTQYLEIEIEHIRLWVELETMHFHSFKMKNVVNPRLPNE